MTLKEEVEKKRTEISVDSYPMSIGEVINIYRDGEIEIHPEFQRIYRWDEEQKSKFIESVLLGIPIPPIFVFQKSNGMWDVIDGQQRLSTILQFAGILKTDDGTTYPPLQLLPTKFLPSLGKVTWNDPETFVPDLKLLFKREKLHFTIIKEKNDGDSSKYELFQRINTGGTHLSAQEIRNCLLVMINKQLYEYICELNRNEHFNNCLPLTDNKADERYDLEYVVRYILYTSLSKCDIDKINKNRNMDVYLTEQIEIIAQNNNIDLDEKKDKFNRIFKLLDDKLGDAAFKKYKNGNFTGPVVVSAFESIIPGLYESIDVWENDPDGLVEKIQSIYTSPEYIQATKVGTRALDRMSQLIPFSRMWFKP